MKKILLPTDFSYNSKIAISYALNFYRDDNCEFTLLHSFQFNENMQAPYDFPIPDDKILNKNQVKEIENSEKKLNMLIQEIKMRYPNSKHSFRKVLQNLPLVSFLNKEVRKSFYDLIVIGTQGITNIEDVTYGTNTIHIMEEVTNCPIFAVPSHVKFSQIKEIVLATGFKTQPMAKNLTFLKELIQKTKAQLKILYIEETGSLSISQKNNKAGLMNLLEGVPYTFHSLAYVSVPIGIYCFIESRGSDMVALINKKHNFFENVLFDPLNKNRGKYSKTPVLVINNSELKNSENP